MNGIFGLTMFLLLMRGIGMGAVIGAIVLGGLSMFNVQVFEQTGLWVFWMIVVGVAGNVASVPMNVSDKINSKSKTSA